MDRNSYMDQRFGVATPYPQGADKGYLSQSGPLTHYPTQYTAWPTQEDPYDFPYVGYHSDAEIHRQDEFFARGAPEVKMEVPDEEEDAPRRSVRAGRKRVTYEEPDDPDYEPEEIPKKKRAIRELSTASSTRSEEVLQHYVPKTKARKYRIKDETEKDEEYKLKRERNNDAVRKSRMKKQEKEKSNELGYELSKKRVVELEKELSEVKRDRVRQQEIIRELLAERAEANAQGPSTSTSAPDSSTYIHPYATST